MTAKLRRLNPKWYQADTPNRHLVNITWNGLNGGWDIKRADGTRIDGGDPLGNGSLYARDLEQVAEYVAHDCE